MFLGANKGAVLSLGLTLLWLCLLGVANVVYGFVATHQLAAFSNLGSSFVTGAAVYVFIIAVSVGLDAFWSRLTGGTSGGRLLSAGAMLSAAVAYFAFVAVASKLASVSFDDTFRIVVPNLLFFAIPIVVLVMYTIQRSAQQRAIDPMRQIGTAAIFLFSAVVLYVLKARLDLSGMPDVLGRFALIFFGIVVPSYFFISALVSTLSGRTEPLKHRGRTLFFAGIGAILIPLIPTIA